LLPNLNIFIELFTPASENWEHIKNYLLQDYVTNSIILVFFTGIFSIGLGVTSAWLITQYDFPLRKFLKWALVLPLAIPPYIGAYTYNGLLNYTGLVQTTLRNIFHFKINPAALDIMSLKGAVFIYTIFLFPYVYLITRSFFEKQSANLIETAKTLGKNDLQIFWKVALPISRSSIVAGTSLVIMEVLNDYGVVKYFGIRTFSTSIFKTWFGMGDLSSAVRLSALLMGFVFIVLISEKFLRGGRKYSSSTSRIKPLTRKKVSNKKGILIMMFPLLIFMVGFIIPTLQLIYWTWMSKSNLISFEIIRTAFNSLGVAIISSLLILITAVIIANTVRIKDNLLSKVYSKVAVLGYSIPGAVIAIGVLSLVITLDNKLEIIYTLLNINNNLLITSSIVMLIFAYFIRFLAIGYNSIESGFDKIGSNFFEASRTLGANVTKTFFKIDLPMLKPSLYSAFLLVMVEVMKELPLTLILRPFNFNTLATKAFEYASDEMIHEAALASLLIILISGIAIYYTTNGRKKE
jgi:iron(III) transport system permease protein